MELKVVISKDKKVRDDAYKVRVSVFVDEQGFVDEFDEIDNFAYHVAAYDGEKAIGSGRIFPERDSSEYHVGRIAVLKDYRGQNVGSEIMREIEKFTAEIGVTGLVLSAQRRARGFYDKIGYEAQGEEYLEEGYPHVFMKKLFKIEKRY